MRARRIILAGLGAVMATLAVATAPAGAATFGAAFARLSDVTETCASASWYPAGPQSSCTFWSVDPGGVYYAPTSGTVTRVRVQAGPSTGPMQVVVLYTLRQNNPPGPPNDGHPVAISGPYQGPLGPTVQPTAPNSVATVDTSLPMIEQAPPPPGDYSSVTRNDFLAISVLDPNTAIPAISDPNAFLKGFAPAPGQGNPNASYVGGGMGYIALNADLEAGTPAAPGPVVPVAPTPPGGGTTPPTGPGPGPGPTVALRNPTVPVRNGVATVPLECRIADCTGLLSLLKAPGRARAAATKPITYGSARFRAKAGKTARVRVKLNRTGRSLLRHHRRVTVAGRVRFTAGGGKAKSFRITLKR